MTAAITGLSNFTGLSLPTTSPTTSATTAGGISFQDLLLKGMGEMTQMNQQAQSAVETSLVGNDLTLVESLTSVREADLALRLMMQVRNKLIDAYQELQQLRM